MRMKSTRQVLMRSRGNGSPDCSGGKCMRHSACFCVTVPARSNVPLQGGSRDLPSLVNQEKAERMPQGAAGGLAARTAWTMGAGFGSGVVLWLLVLLVPLVASAQFDYRVEGGSITITGYSGTNSVVEIPEVLDGLPVVRIGDFAFYFREEIRSLTLPGSVTNVGGDAFEYCTGLTNVDLGGNVVGLGEWAFSGCSGLASITLPDSLVSMGHYAFSYCSRLGSIRLPGRVEKLGSGVFASCQRLVSIEAAPGSRSFSSAGGVLYGHEQTTVVQYPTGLGGTYSIPVTVNRIADGAFDGARLLSGVVIPEGVCDIGIGAFVNCRGLSSVSLPGTLTNLGLGAFSYCTNLTTVDIPDSLIRIGEGPFSVCYNLTSIRVGGGNAAYCSVDGVLFDKSMGQLIQYPGGKPGFYAVPGGVTNLGYAAFMGAKRLTGLELPAGLASMGDWVCANCTSLGGIVIPDTVRGIGAFAFSGCVSLASLRFGTNVSSIGDLAFDRCLSLTNVTIPASVARIGSMAFSGAGNLAGVFFPGGQPGLGVGAFSGCPGAIAYYMATEQGWGTNFGGMPSKLWNAAVLTQDSTFGVRDGRFGFAVSGTPDIPVVVECCGDLRQPVWRAVESGFLTNGQFHFREIAPRGGENRFYRVRWP